MAKDKEEIKDAQETPVETEVAQEERPNRAAYAKMFAEDYPDVDFEDKEARYGKMVEDRQRYKELSDAGRKLSRQLDSHRWVAAMFADLANDETGELDPFTWMAQNGIDVQQAMENEEYRQKVADALKMFQQKQADAEANEKSKEDNLGSSIKQLERLQNEMGLSDEECSELWNYLFESVVVPAMSGEVSYETWKMLSQARNYDKDIANAREEAAMQARNEKHTNKVKSYEEAQVPPSFSQGQSAPVTPQKPKKESNMDFIRRYT